jgi:hypothetical protein
MDVDYRPRIYDSIMSQRTLDNLPVGATVLYSLDPYTKMGEGNQWARSGRGGVVPLSPDPIGGMTVLRSLPEGFEWPHDTLTQFKWRMYHVARYEAERHSVSGAKEALETLGIRRPQFLPGVGMRVCWNRWVDNLTNLPIGSLISSGIPEENTFTLWERATSGWVLRFGSETTARVRWVTVERVGSEYVEQDWINEVGIPDDPALVRFKGEAWTLGTLAQSRHSWCGVFAQVMARFGITSQSVNEAALLPDPDRPEVGAFVSPEVARTLPPGTLLRGYGTEGRVRLFVRRNTATNTSLTEQVGAWGADGLPISNVRNSVNEMQVVGYPGNTEFVVSENVREFVRGLSPGIQFDMNEEPYQTYSTSRIVHRETRVRHRINDTDFATITVRGMDPAHI